MVHRAPLPGRRLPAGVPAARRRHRRPHRAAAHLHRHRHPPALPPGPVGRGDGGARQHQPRSHGARHRHGLRADRVRRLRRQHLPSPVADRGGGRDHAAIVGRRTVLLPRQALPSAADRRAPQARPGRWPAAVDGGDASGRRRACGPPPAQPAAPAQPLHVARPVDRRAANRRRRPVAVSHRADPLLPRDRGS